MSEHPNKDSDHLDPAQIRFDYAWKYFEHHARQRTTVFNFFILFVALIINGFISAIKEDFYLLPIFIGIAGLVITVIFIFLDRRNEELVQLAEDVLKAMESDVIFPDSEGNKVSHFPKRDWTGKKHEKVVETNLAILNRDDALKENKEIKPDYSHGIWMPCIQYTILMVFIILTIYSLFQCA